MKHPIPPDTTRWTDLPGKSEPNPVIAETRNAARRLYIVWQLWRMQVQQRRARQELIYAVLERKRVVDNYYALLASNQARTAALHVQLKTLMGE